VGLGPKKLAASDYFCDFQTDAILVWSGLPTVTNPTNHNRVIPLDLDKRSDLYGN